MSLSPENAAAGRRGKWTLLFVASLLACYVGLGLTASTRKSQTGDEGAHLTGGVSYWAFNDYRIQPENGNWPQRLCGLPVWLVGYQFPSTDSANWRELKQWDVAEQFFYDCGNGVDRMLLYGRSMTAILGVALGLLVFAWSRWLFGPLAGFLSLTLFAFSPTMLTHGFLITSDMASTLFFTASVAALWRLVHRVSAVSLSACWFTLSGLFLSKFAAPMIVPIGGLIVAARLLNVAPLRIEFGTGREISGRLRQLAIFAALVPVLVIGVAGAIWASYGFRYEMLNPVLGPAEVAVPWDAVETRSHIANQLLSVAREWRLLPEGYLYGFSHVLHYSESRSAFLNGEYRRYGWLSFFPYCFAYKTPLALSGCLVLAVAAAWRFRQRSTGVAPLELAGSSQSLDSPSVGGLLYALVPLLALVAVYWAFALVSHLNIGHRHLLPTYPALLIMAGAAAWWIFSPQRNSEPSNRMRRRGFVPLARVTVAACVLWSIADGLWIWPHYLAYFNPLAGGPWNGYRHLVDSSLDWSQDLKGVKAWLDAHPIDARDTQRLYFGFYGAPPPSYYGIQAQRLPSFPDKWEPHVPEPLTSGTYLVSATVLPGIVNLMPGRWNEEFETRYHNLRQNVDVYRQLSTTADGQQQLSTIASPDEWQDMFKMYETARFSRLASFLRQREPDDEIGYSILVYRLTDADIAQALDGPPVEMLKIPEAQSEDLRRGGPRSE